MRRNILGAVAVAALIGVMAPSASADGNGDSAGDEARFVELINRDRVSAGLVALRLVPELVSVGRGWSGEMIVRDPGGDPCVVSHNPQFGEKVMAPWQRLGENVGCGNVDVEYLHGRFMSSPSHYRNIMDPRFDSIGVAVVYDGDVLYVTQQFMEVREVAIAAIPNEFASRTPVRKSTARPVGRKPKRVVATS